MSFCCICFGNRHLIVGIFENFETDSVKTLKNDVSKMLIGLKSALLRNHDFGKLKLFLVLGNVMFSRKNMILLWKLTIRLFAHTTLVIIGKSRFWWPRSHFGVGRMGGLKCLMSHYEVPKYVLWDDKISSLIFKIRNGNGTFSFLFRS